MSLVGCRRGNQYAELGARRCPIRALFAISRPIELKFFTPILRYRLSKFIPQTISVGGTVAPRVHIIFFWFSTLSRDRTENLHMHSLLCLEDNFTKNGEWATWGLPALFQS